MAKGFLTDRYKLAIEIIEDGVAAGRLRADVEPQVIWETIVNPMHLHALLDEPDDDEAARHRIRLVLEGCLASSS